MVRGIHAQTEKMTSKQDKLKQENGVDKENDAKQENYVDQENGVDRENDFVFWPLVFCLLGYVIIFFLI